MDIASEGAHNGEDNCPLSIIVDFIYLVHQVCPLFKGYSFLCWNFFVYQLADKFVFVRLLSTASIYRRECRQVVVVLIVCDDPQLIDWLKFPFALYVVKYTIGKGEELLVSLTAHTLALLITVCLDFGTHYEVSAHISLDSFPLPFFAIEVYSLVIDENFLY